MSDERPNVLFLCGWNSCRSQVGAAVLRRIAGDLCEVRSAGLEPTGEIHPMTIRVLEEAGHDLSGHRASQPRTTSDDYRSAT